MRNLWDLYPPLNRAKMKGTDEQRADWWHIRCWLKPRLYANGVTTKEWARHKRRLQKQLRDEGYEATAKAAARLLHRVRTEKKARERMTLPTV